MVDCHHWQFAFNQFHYFWVVEIYTGYYYSIKATIPEEYMKEVAYRDTVQAGIKTEELLALKNPPTCILYADDFSALGGMNVIKLKELHIPEDVSIAGYDGINIANLLEPKLTTIKQDTKTMGKTAAEKLISLIEKPKSTIVQPITIEGTLVEGKSVRSI